MKKQLLNLKVVLIVIMAAGILAACSKKDEKPADLIVGNWSVSNVDISINGQSLTDYLVGTGFVSQESADSINTSFQQNFKGTVNFKSDNTVTFNIGDAPSGGTWSINSAGDKVTITPDDGSSPMDFDIISLDSKNLHIKFSTEMSDDTNGDGTPDVTITLDVDMKLTK